MTIGQSTERPATGEPTEQAPAQLPGQSRAAAAARVDGVVRVALTVPGVAGVRVEPDADGSASVRLELVPGADEAQVAAAVQAALAADAAVGPVGPVGPVAETSAPEAAAPVQGAPAVVPLAVVPPVEATGRPGPRVPAPTAAPDRPDRPGRSPRTGRTSVPPVSASSVAATPAPQWLGESAPAARPERGERLVLDRVQVVTAGLSTTATVVLTLGTAVHTGVCESANTPAGGPRALASATLRALESAAAGRLRGEVEAVRAGELDGRPAVTVMLGVATSRGSEQLVGAALEGGQQPAVVRAVLQACNRRLDLDLR